MILYPNAKINLGLYITSKRADGYHNLETVFYPIPFKDILELKKSEQDEFVCTGLAIPQGDNLCTKALELFRSETGIKESVFMHLHKQIPMGAGLGGGSSDAAFVLKGLNELFKANLKAELLSALALKLGADCPFFILNKPAYAEGLGEQLSEIDLDLKGFHLVLAHKDLHISTAKAFSGIQPKDSGLNLRLCMQEPPSFWKGEVSNDFEQTVFNEEGSLAEIKDFLYQQGAAYASLTGTGSVVYGLFPNNPDLGKEHNGFKLHSFQL